jgi:hypothetical protein
MGGRKLRERKPVSYDEKALEAKRYNDVFEFMDSESELKQGEKGRSAICQARSNLGSICIALLSPKITREESSAGLCAPASVVVGPTCTNGANTRSGSCRSRVLDDEREDAKSNGNSDFVDDDNQQQSLDEPSEEDDSADSDFAAEKMPVEPTRKLANRGNAVKTGIYKEPSSGDEDDDGNSSSGASFTP